MEKLNWNKKSGLNFAAISLKHHAGPESSFHRSIYQNNTHIYTPERDFRLYVNMLTHLESLKQHSRWKGKHSPQHQHQQDRMMLKEGADLQHVLTWLFAARHAYVCMTVKNPYLCFNAIDKTIKCVSLCEGKCNGAMGFQ